jgi:hypothetical protein
MITLGLVCLFLSVILLIMGAMAWGSMNMKDFDDEASKQDTPAQAQDETESR